MMTADIHVPQISQPAGSKPVKLRSACNCCFAAKVRCDGDKSGCKRCADKHLPCIYSISRVGKVVGKRRKKPLPDVKAEETAAAQVHSPFLIHAAGLSPASTQLSDDSRASCATTGWDSYTPFNYAAGPLSMADNNDHVYDSDAINGSTFSMSDNIQFAMQHGLPTPSLSPPCIRRMSPGHLDINGSLSVPNMLPPSISPTAESHKLHNLDAWPSTQQEDDETVCIKLLAHLKRHTLRVQVSHEATLTLIRKTNAALRRILLSEHNRSDASCRLLLSSISVQLAKLCEILAQAQGAQPAKTFESEFIHDAYLEDAQRGTCVQPTKGAEVREACQSAISESVASNASIANLLKRKPSQGFQALGRQESLHVELDMRMKKALLRLS